MSSLVPGTLGHLSQEHLDFYVHWCLLLDLEAKANTDKGGISDLWCKTGHQRYLLCWRFISPCKALASKTHHPYQTGHQRYYVAIRVMPDIVHHFMSKTHHPYQTGHQRYYVAIRVMPDIVHHFMSIVIVCKL